MQASKNKPKTRISAKPKTIEEAKKLIEQFEEEMRLSAENLEFEKAIALRDKILELRKACE
jgi:excinuclease UvrABC helicase subunit UvrB